MPPRRLVIYGLTILALLSAPEPSRAQGIITTVAGNGNCCTYIEGRQATSVYVAPSRVTSDSAGNLFMVDGNFIRKVNTAGIITTIAGVNNVGFSGDGGPATRATLFGASHVALDSFGNIYIPDTVNNRVRKVTATTGIISTIAGTGAGAGTGGGSFSGDGGPATSAALDNPASLAFDRAGNLYIADGGNSRVRRIDTATGIITTIAGNGFGFSGDGGPATAAAMERPVSLAFDAMGNLYISDSQNGRIRKVDTSGNISTFAGKGKPFGFSGDGGPATNAQIFGVLGLAVDSAGNLYLADSTNGRVRRVDTAGIITTVAGNGVFASSGDGGPAAGAAMKSPSDVSLDGADNLYIVESDKIRKVSAGAALSTSLSLLVFSYTIGGAAPASQPLSVTSSGAALSFTVSTSTTWMAPSTNNARTPATVDISILPAGLGVGVYQGTITLTPSGSTPRTVAVTLSVTASGGPVSGAPGVIGTVAGTGNPAFSGDGGAGPSAAISTPQGVAVDSVGNVYIADTGNRRIRKVNPAGIIATAAGNGSLGFAGDGGPATSAGFDPRGTTHQGVAVDSNGNFYFADIGNDRVRKVNLAGVITTAAGVANSGFAGDGGLATSAALSTPVGVALDGDGNLYIADSGNNRIRKVKTAGTIGTIAGNGSLGFAGDGGLATAAALNTPTSIAVDSAGNVYISDFGNHRIRKVSASGTITTFAGGALGGSAGFSGDGGPASAAQLSAPSGVAVDSAGNVYIADSGNFRVRKVNAAGTISTFAGNLFGPFGDGGPATNAQLKFPTDVAVDSAGNVYIADGSDHRVRKVFSGAAAPSTGTPAISAGGVVHGASFEPGFGPGQWITIRGTNLANVTKTLDFAGGNYPTQSDGVSVSINGRAAALYYLSPSQINAISPDLSGSGPVQVVVTNNGTPSASFTAQLQPFAPAFFGWPGGYAVATDPNFNFKVKDGTFPGTVTTPARPGDVIVLWGTGFGPTTPTVAAGRQTPGDRAYPVAGSVRVTIGALQAEFFGAALAPGFAALYQIAVRVPDLGDGDYSVVAEIGGISSPSTTRLTVQR